MRIGRRRRGWDESPNVPIPLVAGIAAVALSGLLWITQHPTSATGTSTAADPMLEAATAPQPTVTPTATTVRRYLGALDAAAGSSGASGGGAPAKGSGGSGAPKKTSVMDVFDDPRPERLR